MANNYCQMSCMLSFKPEQKEKAQAIIDRLAKEFETGEFGDEYESFDVEVDVEDNGVWFHSDESANIENVALIARTLIDELEIDEPFYCSWAYTCSKPRLDEFGGGAFVMVRGKETYWVDALNTVMNQMEKGGLVDLED